MSKYAIKEAFLTIQGEGYHAGRRAVFVRFSGCNVWSGREQDRERDAAKGLCARWCDTDFNGTDGTHGGKYTADQLAALVVNLWNHHTPPTVVFTGGEPSLWLDENLMDALDAAEVFSIHVETNGSNELPSRVDWVTLSPKPPMRVVQQHYDEVKVIYPIFNPLEYQDMAKHRFVQPLDADDHGDAAVKACINFVMRNPLWRMSLQTHKIVGVP